MPGIRQVPQSLPVNLPVCNIMKCKLGIFVLFVLISLVLAHNAAAQARIAENDASLILLSNQLIVDTNSRLMWASFDNGQDITFSVKSLARS